MKNKIKNVIDFMIDFILNWGLIIIIVSMLTIICFLFYLKGSIKASLYKKCYNEELIWHRALMVPDTIYTTCGCKEVFINIKKEEKREDSNED